MMTLAAAAEQPPSYLSATVAIGRHHPYVIVRWLLAVATDVAASGKVCPGGVWHQLC
jgi:hypothetical protein